MILDSQIFDKLVGGGKKGYSGDINLVTGMSNDDNSGAVRMSTGSSQHGSGGNIELSVGESNSRSYRKTFHGADINMRAGDSWTKGGTGGSVHIAGGSGLLKDRVDGGNGGSIELYGGRGGGLNKIKDAGKKFIEIYL